MRLLAFALLIIATAVSSYGAEWYKNLPPGITRTEILQIAGTPSSTKSEIKSYDGQSGIEKYSAQMDRYDMEGSYLVLTYDKEALLSCTRYSWSNNQLDNSYYFVRDSLSADGMPIRRNYLNSQQYSLLPSFHDRNFIRTSKYPGEECYPIDNSFLIITPMTFSGNGFFADKTAKVTILDDKRKETIRYRAIDNWKNLRPPQVDDKKLKERAKLITEVKKKYPDKNYNIVDILGPPDSVMGSGIPYVVYYLKEGLVVGVAMKPQMIDITIRRPGE